MVPAQGQLVTVRNRQWVVASVVDSEIASSDPHFFSAARTHLVTLVSIEDDARDEELRVVWELEVGAVVHETAVLPGPENGFDEPSELDAFLDAVRWGAIASADTSALQAPFRSGIQIEDYQLDPVVRALSMPRTNLLIADDVGMGKTIEAGLVMQELALRHRARTMLIVCPAGLTLQWRDEMRDKFGLDFRIVDSDLLKQLRRARGPHANPWTHYPRLIVSVDWLKRSRPMRLLQQVLPATPRYPREFDLLVVDEVHTCAPSGRGKYAVDSLRTKAIRTLAPHCEHRLFLSATPHNGYLESFTALLEMLDDQRFARNVRPSEEQLKRAMVRRLKSELPKKWDGSSYFGTRELDYLEVDHSEAEREVHDLLRRYSDSRRGRGPKTAADFVTTLLKRRLFSSPEAFTQTVEVHLATMTERDHGTDEALAPQVLPVLIDRITEAADEDDADSGHYREAETDALRVARRGTPSLTAEEKRLLEQLRDWATAARDRPDSKIAALLEHLRPVVDEADERIIIFTEYRDTQRWLHERLLGAGYPPEKIALLYGGQDVDERERIKSVFTEDPELDPVRILLATDAASEGINLQRHCHRVLHWEIPWNPNRLEQRNGRVDRHGQPAPVVLVHHFVPKGWEKHDFAEGSLEDELAFLEVAVRKVHQIREDLGSAGEVIAAQIEQKMVGERGDWQTADREITQRAGRAKLKVERDLARDLERLTEELRSSRAKLNLHPATVRRVVDTALKLAHRQELRPATPPPGFDGEVFRLPELPGAWAAARNDGLHHPVTGEERVVSFDQEAVAGRTDVVLLHLGHRLVQMCMGLLRAELWAQTKAHLNAAAGGGGSATGAKLHRITTRVMSGDTLRVPAVVAHGRVVVTGADGSRLHEEIVSAGGLVEQGRFSLIRKVDEVDALLAAASEEPAHGMRDKFTELWPVLKDPLAKALNTRADQRLRSMRVMLRDRCDEEVEGIGKVLEELEKSIRAALDDTDVWQPSLFEVDDERDQLRADHDALRARLEAIPEQQEREVEALRRRYADPTTRWFPVAVTLLVPSAIARGAGR
ncbi:SNF2 domain-containing protein [Saccharothrix carnea]|uniref:SNF2 domain-containing protein n=1 Tax=Saccharothrix carnea TaxID=1280637 RepID=A0A2P8IDN1_SACCR|nr:SNF2 domain-containing protein [Saccharothrix carnea]